MDKLDSLYQLYLDNGLLSSKTSINQFKEADVNIQEKLYQLGKDNNLFSTTDLSTFQSAWGEVKKKDVSVLPSEVSTSGLETGELVSGEAKDTIDVEIEQPKVDIPKEDFSNLEEKIYQGIYGEALKRGDTSVPTMEQWKESPELFSAKDSGEASKEALDEFTDPESYKFAAEQLSKSISKAAKNVEHTYDESFIGDLIRSAGSGSNPVLRAATISKKIEKISADKTLNKEEKQEKIDNLSAFDAAWASEPFVNITDYTPEETNEFAVGVMSALLDFAFIPEVGFVKGASSLYKGISNLASAPKFIKPLETLAIGKKASKLSRQFDKAISQGAKFLDEANKPLFNSLLRVGKATQELLVNKFSLSPEVANRIIQKQLPEFVKRMDATGVKFGTFDAAKDFQMQLDQYGGIEGVDFSQSEEAFNKGYGLGLGFGVIGAAGSQAPKLGAALKMEGKAGVAQKGVSGILYERGLMGSRILGTLGQGAGVTGEAITFGVINATTPTLKNPEGELTLESFKDGTSEALKYIIAFRGVGLAKQIAQGKSVFNKQKTEFNKTEKEKAWDIYANLDAKAKKGNVTEKEVKDYLDGVIKRAEAPISLIDKISQELSGMKSNLTRESMFNKIFEVKAQARPDGSFDVNTFSKDGLWLTTKNVKNPSEVNEIINNLKKERNTLMQTSEELFSKLEPNVTYDINLQPIQDIISPPAMEFKIPRIDESPIGSGKPVLFNQPNPEASEISSSYIANRTTELDLVEPEAKKVESLDVDNSKQIADAYDNLVDNPTAPEVKSAYDAMAKETIEQYEAILDKGYKIEIWEGEGEPYKNSAEMIADVRDNKHMYIFGTEAGFGEGAITPEKRAENAMLAETQYKDVTGKTLLVNDVFRFVHDFFGHTELGNGFGPIGEENAWMVHSRMYSPEARRAMTTETRGQNSWVNFNKSLRREDGSMPKRGDADYIPLSQRPFAEQKMGLLPDNMVFPEGVPAKAQAPVEAELGELEFYRAGKTDPKDLDPEMAKDFAKAVFLSKDKDFVQGWDKNKKYGEGDIKRIKIDIKNPFDTNNPNTWDAALKNKIFTRKQLETLRDRGEYLMEVEGMPDANYMQPTKENNWLIIEQKGEELKDAGYDSFYVYERGARNVGVFNKGVYSEVTEAPAEVAPVEVKAKEEFSIDKPKASLPIKPTEQEAKMIEDMKSQGLPPMEIVLRLKDSYLDKLPPGVTPPAAPPATQKYEIALRDRAELVVQGSENPNNTVEYFDLAAKMLNDKSTFTDRLNSALNYGRKIGRKYFRPQGVAPRDAMVLKELRVGKLNRAATEAKFLNEKLKVRVDNHNKKNPDSKIDYLELNEYLQSYMYGPDPKLTRGEMSQQGARFSSENDFIADKDILITKIFPTVESREAYLKGKDPMRFDLKQKTDKEGSTKYYTTYKPEVLPTEIRTVITEMRIKLDEMTKEIVDSGIVEGDLRTTLSENLGVWTHRTVSAFEKGSERTYESIRDKEPGNFIIAVRHFQRQEAPKLRKEKPDLTGLEFEQELSNRVEAEMRSIISPEARFNMFKDLQREFKQSVDKAIIEGKKDVTALKKRKHIHEDLIGYLGLVGDARNNFMESTMALAEILYNHKYQLNLKDSFEGREIFQNASDVIASGKLRVGQSPVQFETTNQDIVDPLAGMWTTPDIKEELSSDAIREKSNFVWRFMTGGITTYKLLNTITSPFSHALQVSGNLGMVFANDVLLHKRAGQNILKSLQSVWVTAGGKRFTEQYEKDYLEYVELGIVGNSVNQKILLDLISETELLVEDPTIYGVKNAKNRHSALSKLSSKPKEALEFLGKIYGGWDDAFKVLTYEVLKDRNLDIYMRSGLTEAEAKAKIADHTKRETPTYSRIQKPLQEGKYRQVIAPWASFPISSINAMIGSQQNIFDMYKDSEKAREEGRTEDADRLKAQAIRKEASQVVFSALMLSASKLMLQLFGDEDDSETSRSAKLFHKFYQDNSDTYPVENNNIRDKKGNVTGARVSYYDYGSSNVYGTSHQIINAWFNKYPALSKVTAGERPEDLDGFTYDIYNNLKSTVEAFGVNGNVFTDALLEIKNNEDMFGRKIYSPNTDGIGDAGLKIAKHMINRAFVPGIWKGYEKLQDANDFNKTLAGLMTGVRYHEIDVMDQVKYKSYAFSQEYLTHSKDARKLEREFGAGDINLDEYKEKSDRLTKSFQDEIAKMNAVYRSAYTLLTKNKDGSVDPDTDNKIHTFLTDNILIKGGMKSSLLDIITSNSIPESPIKVLKDPEGFIQKEKHTPSVMKGGETSVDNFVFTR